uniref:Uncharacterized protein n=1 Tax=viral metagenome TaxID=1070528 RepID=A0A6M3IYD5_9ZZZZ
MPTIEEIMKRSTAYLDLLAALAEKDEQLDSLLAESIILARQKDELKEQIATLKEALKWVLPMAKAYAAEHPVGRNQIIVNEAQAALRGEGVEENDY